MDDLALWIIIGFCTWALTKKSIETGVLMSAGLGMIIIGCIAILDDYAYVQRAFTLRAWGTVLVCGGLFWRLALRPWWRRHTHQPALGAAARFMGVDRRRTPH